MTSQAFHHNYHRFIHLVAYYRAGSCFPFFFHKLSYAVLPLSYNSLDSGNFFLDFGKLTVISQLSGSHAQFDIKKLLASFI
jgi:hypothetical protein